MVASRDEKILKEILEEIQDDWFDWATNQDELIENAQLRIIWHALKNYYREFHELPSNEILKNEIERFDIENFFSEEKINEFISYREKSEIIPGLALNYYNHWKIKRAFIPTIDHILSNGYSPEEIIDKVRSVCTSIKFSSDRNVCYDPLSAILNDDTPNNLIPTNVPFIDNYIGGGFGQTDVAILLGATGSGKTTLGAQIIASMAKEAYSRNEDIVFVMATYEDTAGAVGRRIISNLATIPRNKLKSRDFLNELSDKNNPQQYEKKIQARNKNFIIGERERFEAIMPIIENHIRILDYARGGTAKDSRTVGCGGFLEICRDIEKIEKRIGIIVIDWIGMLVDRYLELVGSKNQQTDEHIRLRRSCDEAYKILALKFNCPVLLIHQLSGTATSKSPTAKLSHADALGCRTIAVNAWHVFVMGTKDHATNTVKFHCTKTRHAESKSPRILQLDGDIARFIDVTDSFFIDPYSERIINKSLLGTLSVEGRNP